MKKHKQVASPNEVAGTTLGRQSLPWVIGLVLLLIAGLALIGEFLLVEGNRNSQQQVATSLAQQQAVLIDYSLKTYQAWAAALATNAAVNEALSDPQKAQALTAQLSQLQAPAKVFLVSDQDQATAASLSFLDRDSLSKVSAKAPVVLLTAGENSELLMVMRSSNGLGSIVVEQPLNGLWQRVHQQLPVGGGISVMQGSLALLQDNAGSLSSTKGTAQAMLGVTVTTWVPARGGLQLPLFLLIAIGLVLLVCVLLWLFIGRLAGLVRRDADLLVQQSRRLVQGSGTGVEAIRLLDLQPLSGALKAVLQAAPPKTTDKETGKKTKRQDGFTDMLVEEGMSMLVGQDQKQAATTAAALPEEIFRAYDIRGEVGKMLTAEYVELIGRAIGSEAMDAGQQTVLVARDGRLSGPDLSEALIKGLRASGRDVIDIGAVPTPVLYYATKVLDSQTGVCLTGSHNPEQYNGLKIVINGEALYGERIQALRARIAQGKLRQGAGKLETRDISERYMGDIHQDIVLAKQMKVVIDCGNGIAGKLAPQLFRDLGCQVTELFCEVDGHFPNHHPDPGKEENLQDLIRTVQAEKADVGLAFDGDGDRVGVVTSQGQIIWPDRLLMLFAQDVLSRSPGVDIIFDVKCSRALPALIRRLGGRPLMWKTGHSLIKAKLKETGAPLAGEMSGHIFFADRWFGVDDGLYAAARLLEVLSLSDKTCDRVFEDFKTGITTPELQVKTTEDGKFRIVKQLCAQAAQFGGGSPTTLDGLRVDYPDGWGLVRASNTTPLLIARFEGKDEESLARIKQQFHKQLAAIDSSLDLPF